MLLTDARRPARTGPEGELIRLDEQDRTLWDRNAIAEGVALITDTLSRGSIGAYQLQAAINHYRIAAGRTNSLPEQRYLLARAARLSQRE
jgi:predicted RNA polymerase sigma factor